MTGSLQCRKVLWVVHETLNGTREVFSEYNVKEGGVNWNLMKLSTFRNLQKRLLDQGQCVSSFIHLVTNKSLIIQLTHSLLSSVVRFSRPGFLLRRHHSSSTAQGTFQAQHLFLSEPSNQTLTSKEVKQTSVWDQL